MNTNNYENQSIFSVLHGMPVQSSGEKGVRLSVKRVHCDKMEESSVQMFIPYERPFSLVFLRRRMVGGGRPLLPQILGQPAPIGVKLPILSRYLLVRCPAAPKGGSKMQNGHLSCKMALRLNKVCYKVSLCENCQRQSCKATIRAKMIGGGDPFYLKFCVKLTSLERNCRFLTYFRL